MEIGETNLRVSLALSIKIKGMCYYDCAISLLGITRKNSVHLYIKRHVQACSLMLLCPRMLQMPLTIERKNVYGTFCSKILYNSNRNELTAVTYNITVKEETNRRTHTK